MKTKLNLSDITICAADSANLALTTRALHLSMEKCSFGDAILFSHAHVDASFRTVKINKFNSLADYQIFRLQQLPKLIDTPFALVVEWDGYVTDPRAWHPIFLEYDYIGARWPHYFDGMTVGNSGFSLQSRKLFSALADPRFIPVGNESVDTLICRTYRPILERDYGIRFAAESIADLFSYENHLPNRPTFGFHGCGNMWRHAEDSEMIKVVDLVEPYVFRTLQFAALVVNYCVQRKFFPLEEIYAKMRKHIGPEDTLKLLRQAAPSPADQIFFMCEQILSRSNENGPTQKVFQGPHMKTLHS